MHAQDCALVTGQHWTVSEMQRMQQSQHTGYGPGMQAAGNLYTPIAAAQAEYRQRHINDAIHHLSTRLDDHRRINSELHDRYAPTIHELRCYHNHEEMSLVVRFFIDGHDTTYMVERHCNWQGHEILQIVTGALRRFMEAQTVRVADMDAVVARIAPPLITILSHHDRLREERARGGLGNVGWAGAADYTSTAHARGGLGWAGVGVDHTSTAHARGQALLRSHLTPKQLQMMDTHGGFVVYGEVSKKPYFIRTSTTTAHNMLTIEPGIIQPWVKNLCFLPTGNLCRGDVFLTQKFAIETREREVSRVANTHHSALSVAELQRVFDEALR